MYWRFLILELILEFASEFTPESALWPHHINAQNPSTPPLDQENSPEFSYPSLPACILSATPARQIHNHKPSIRYAPPTGIHHSIQAQTLCRATVLRLLFESHKSGGNLISSCEDSQPAHCATRCAKELGRPSEDHFPIIFPPNRYSRTVNTNRR